MLNKVKKVLIVGDSNCLPRYTLNKKETLNNEDLYNFKLKKKLTKYNIEQVVWGGITTVQLTNFAILYFEKWVPDLLIIHSGINDVKNQFISNSLSNKLYRLLSFFKISKKTYKESILYNSNLIKHHHHPKLDIDNFNKQIFKIKSSFKKTKIIYIGIHSNKKVDKERPHTYKIINAYNDILKNQFKELFIDDQIFKKNQHYTKDGYHLNKEGHLILLNRLLKIIK